MSWFLLFVKKRLLQLQIFKFLNSHQIGSKWLFLISTKKKTFTINDNHRITNRCDVWNRKCERNTPGAHKKKNINLVHEKSNKNVDRVDLYGKVFTVNNNGNQLKVDQTHFNNSIVVCIVFELLFNRTRGN